MDQLSKCPQCKQTNLEASRPEPDDQDLWRTVTCDDCGYQWVEVFKFSHSEDMEGKPLDDGQTIVLRPFKPEDFADITNELNGEN